jgi:outer membrane protein assembly factor BamB
LGSPVVSGGKVFYLDAQAGRETLHAFEAASGREVWQVAVDDTFKDNQTAAGPRNTPLVDGDRVYVSSCRGEFRCLATADGKTLWRVNFVADFGAVFTGEKGLTPGAARHGYTASPAIEGDRMFVTVGGAEGASVVCFDKRNGTVLWKSQNDIPGYGGPVIASPGGVKQVLAFTTEGAMGLRFDQGEILWRVPMKTSYGRHAFSPVVVGDMVIVSSHQNGLLGVRVSQRGDKVEAATAFLEKRVAVNFSSPVAVDGFLFGLGAAGMLFCVDAQTGQEVWSHEMPGGGKKEHAGFIAMKGNLLVLTEAGEVLLIAADPKAFRLLGRVAVCGENWCNPAYADGRLYLRDADELLCVQLLQ